MGCQVIDAIPEGIPVLLDAKRGEQGSHCHLLPLLPSLPLSFPSLATPCLSLSLFIILVYHCVAVTVYHCVSGTVSQWHCLIHLIFFSVALFLTGTVSHSIVAGDIGSTSAAYAKAAFETLGADIVTISPYLGHDGVSCQSLAHTALA